jgi:hypothetical protein
MKYNERYKNAALTKLTTASADRVIILHSSTLVSAEYLMDLRDELSAGAFYRPVSCVDYDVVRGKVICVDPIVSPVPFALYSLTFQGLSTGCLTV